MHEVTEGIREGIDKLVEVRVLHAALLPLPLGEGWGEGCDREMPAAANECTSR